MNTDSAGAGTGPLTPSHARQRQPSVTTPATVDGLSSVTDSVKNAADKEKETIAQDSADTSNLPPLLGANEATVAEAIEVCSVSEILSFVAKIL